MGDRSRGRSRRKDTSEVSLCVKYTVFGFNVFFWLLGAGLLAIGLWAWSEKEMFDNVGKLVETGSSSVFLDPVLVLIIAGTVVFVIGFCGCLGALRENTILLMIYIVAVGVIFLSQVTIGVVAFLYKDWLKEQITTQLKTMIVSYRDPDKLDLQNLIDWIQEDWLSCCGANGPQDWDENIYFNCTQPKLTVESCGVPFSCCKPDDSAIKNTQCGYDSRKLSDGKLEATIVSKVNNKGCVTAGEDWLNSNLVPVAGVVTGVAVLQILGMCFAQNLRSDVSAQKSKWQDY